MRRFAAPALIVLLPMAAMADSLPTVAPPTVEQIIDRLRSADAARNDQLEGYTAVRRYELNNRRFHKQATILARLTYQRPGEKNFEVLSEEGSKLICDRVLRRMISTEADASHGNNRGLARIDFINYGVELAGTEVAGGRLLYILKLTPKSKSPYLVKGQAWIDADEYALVRLEGTLAQRPSIWVGSPLVRQTYAKSGRFWLPEKNSSTTDAPVFGKTDVTIESTNYDLQHVELAEKIATPTGH